MVATARYVGNVVRTGYRTERLAGAWQAAKPITDHDAPGIGWLAAALLAWAVATSLLAATAMVVLPLVAILAPIVVAARAATQRIGRWHLPRRRWRPPAIAAHIPRGSLEMLTRARGFGSASST